MNNFERLFSRTGLSFDRLRSFLLVAEAGNQSKAAKGDINRQSQFSRQIKELESYFGVPLTRLVGRRVEITKEGHHLAGLIRRYFGELDDFRESMNGRPICVSIGTQGSLIDWLLVSRLAASREALGGALIEFEQLRSDDVVRGVVDGRLDFGIVRENAVGSQIRKWPLGSIGYALFAPTKIWQENPSVKLLMETSDVAELLPGGQFSSRLREWLTEQKIHPRIVCRMPSFVHLARMTRESGVATVLPEIARAGFDDQKITGKPLPWKVDRKFALIANPRNLDRSGLRTRSGFKSLN